MAKLPRPNYYTTEQKQAYGKQFSVEEKMSYRRGQAVAFAKSASQALSNASYAKDPEAHLARREEWKNSKGFSGKQASYGSKSKTASKSRTPIKPLKNSDDLPY